MFRNLDQNAMADEILQLYLDNRLEKKNAFKYLLPTLSELKEFISNIKRFKRSRQLEETIIGVKCQPIDIVGSNK